MENSGQDVFRFIVQPIIPNQKVKKSVQDCLLQLGDESALDWVKA